MEVYGVWIVIPTHLLVELPNYVTQNRDERWNFDLLDGNRNVRGQFQQWSNAWERAFDEA